MSAPQPRLPRWSFIIIAAGGVLTYLGFRDEYKAGPALSDRFRARLTAERVYPPLALLWLPGCIAALVPWAWRRVAR